MQVSKPKDQAYCSLALSLAVVRVKDMKSLNGILHQRKHMRDSQLVLYLRRAASALSDPGSGALFRTIELLPDSALVDACCKPTLKTWLQSPATLSMTGCKAAGKKVANLNSSLGSPLHAMFHASCNAYLHYKHACKSKPSRVG